MSSRKDLLKDSRESFLRLVSTDFPEAKLGDKYSEGLLHCEIADFRIYLEDKVEGGDFWVAEKGFKLIEDLLGNADSDLKNAIEISFLKDFAIGCQTEKQLKFVKERVSKNIKEILKQHSSVWS